MGDFQLNFYLEALSGTLFGIFWIIIGKIILNLEDLIGYFRHSIGIAPATASVQQHEKFLKILKLKNAAGYLLIGVGIITIINAIYTAITLQQKFGRYDPF